MRGVHLRTWGEAHQGAVGQRAVAVHLEVDWDGVQDGLQVLLLLQAAGGVRRRGRSCKHKDSRLISINHFINFDTHNLKSHPKVSQSAFYEREGEKQDTKPNKKPRPGQERLKDFTDHCVVATSVVKESITK